MTIEEPTPKAAGEDCDRKLNPEDYVIYNDSLGIMHFLPPKRCKTCDE